LKYVTIYNIYYVIYTCSLRPGGWGSKRYPTQAPGRVLVL